MNEKIKVIIGDESKEFGCMLANSLRGRGFFAVTRDRRSAPAGSYQK